MIDWFFNYHRIISQDLFLLQDLLQPHNHTAHHVCMVHAGVLYGEIGGFSEFMVCCPEKLIEPNPRPLYCCHAITFANCQSELARSVNNDVRYAHRLVLGV